MKFDDTDGIVPGVASCLRSKQNERERERERICKFRTEGRGFSRETVGRTERRTGRGEENESEVEKKSTTSKGMHEARRKDIVMKRVREEEEK